MYGHPVFTSQIEIDHPTRIVTVSLTGTLDPSAVEKLQPEVQDLINGGYNRFVFDLAGLGYMGSLGLRLLLGVHNQVKANGAVVLCELTSTVQSVIDTTKMHQILRTYATRAEALDAIRGL